MEVILRGVPPNLTEASLRKELGSFMSALGITNWSCDKPRRKNLAWVAFHNPADGNKFLSKHGQVQAASETDPASLVGWPSVAEKPILQTARADKTVSAASGKSPSRARKISRLRITETPVYVDKSHRTIKERTANHVKHEQRDGERALTHVSGQSDLTFSLHRVACGHNYIAEDTQRLTYGVETWCDFRTPVMGTLTQRLLSIRHESRWRMDIPCDTIQDFIAGEIDCTFTVVLKEPPRFYGQLSPHASGKWYRGGLCPEWEGLDRYSGTCLVYQLSVLQSEFPSRLRSINNRDLISVTQDTLPVNMLLKPLMLDYASSMEAFNSDLEQSKPGGEWLPFPLLFQVQALVYNNYLHPATGRAMLSSLRAIARETRQSNMPLPFTVDSMKKLFQQIPYPCPGVLPAQLDAQELLGRTMDFEQKMRENMPHRPVPYGVDLPENQAWVLKAMVTPTRTLFHGPEPESKNRILRKFPKHTEYFLRCLFCDEDGQDLSYNPNVSNERVYQRYRGVLENGLRIGPRHFSFLGFSHSSLRSHSVWFVAPFTDQDWQQQNRDTIIKAIGKFDDIRVPAKCAARIGQAFSETPYSVPLFDVGIGSRYIPDVKSNDGSRVFSDGVGTISPAAVQEFRAHLPDHAASATCFQIRWGGSKGMLSLDTRLTGKIICVRKESMMKFQSNDLMDLGICDTASSPLRLTLNRQMIKILEDMGTSKKWFLDMQDKALDTLGGVTSTAAKTSRFLRHQQIGTSMGFPRFIKQLDGMGIDYRRDKFLRTVVEHVVLRELRLLKHKARIPVEKGVTLFGVMDETGYLEENQIYFTFKQTDSPIAAAPTSGKVIITRSPALHPGDVRTAQVVRPPPNSPVLHLKNCVVFSQRGSRDLPSKLSGGDLDGDLYNVIWDQEALPKVVYDPADYPRVNPRPLNRAVTQGDIADFFINFMRTDILGMIAVRHQIMADFKDGGTLAPDCITLAEMHSTAVDSSKTGIPVDATSLPRPPPMRPDFLSPAPPLKTYDIGQVAHIEESANTNNDSGMGFAKHRFYRSGKILGELYRRVDENKIWMQDISRKVDETPTTIWIQMLGLVHQRIDKLGVDIQCARQLEKALTIRNWFESAVSDVMYQFSGDLRTPISEVEVFCGFILNKHGSQTHRQRDSSIKLREEIERVMTWIASVIRNQAQTSQRGIVELCLACVYIGCSNDKLTDTAFYNTNEVLHSFKVLASACLLQELYQLESMIDETHEGLPFIGQFADMYMK